MIPFAGWRGPAARAVGDRRGHWRWRAGPSRPGGWTQVPPGPDRSEAAGPWSWIRPSGNRPRPTLWLAWREARSRMGWRRLDQDCGPRRARPWPAPSRSAGDDLHDRPVGADFHAGFSGPDYRKIGYRHHYRNHRDNDFDPFWAPNRQIRQPAAIVARAAPGYAEIRGRTNRQRRIGARDRSPGPAAIPSPPGMGAAIPRPGAPGRPGRVPAGRAVPNLPSMRRRSARHPSGPRPGSGAAEATH